MIGIFSESQAWTPQKIKKNFSITDWKELTKKSNQNLSPERLFKYEMKTEHIPFGYLVFDDVDNAIEKMHLDIIKKGGINWEDFEETDSNDYIISKVEAIYDFDILVQIYCLYLK